MKFYTIYQTTNQVNGKVYIGKHITNDPYDDYLGSGKNLRRAVEKYGSDQFKKEVLFSFDNEDDMNLKEKELVTEEFCARSDTYNICEGGKGGFGWINKNVSLREAKNKKAASITNARYDRNTRSSWVSQALKRDWSNGTRDISKKFSEAGRVSFLGKTHTDEVKAKIGAANRVMTGSKNSQFGTKWITNGVVNKKMSKSDQMPSGWRYGRV